MQRELGLLRHMSRQTTNLNFVASLLMLAAFILSFIPASGIALLVTSSGAWSVFSQPFSCACALT
jgi:hypothetical protein